MIDYSELCKHAPNTYSMPSGFIINFCKNLPESSMHNYSLEELNSNSKKFLILNHRKKILGEQFIETLHQSALLENHKLSELVRIKNKVHCDIDEHIEKAAITIQRFIRGWRDRLKYDQQIIERSRRVTMKLLLEMTQQITSSSYKGRILNKAAMQVQRIFKGWNYRKHNKTALLKMKTDTKR